MKLIEDAIYGAKGGGGGSGSAKQTLRSTVTGKFIDLISEGPCTGIVNGAQGVYFDNTPIQASDGTWNVSNLTFAQRTGLASQTIVPGFSAVENEIQAGATITTSQPQVRDITDGNVDACRVTIAITQGLWTNSGKDPSSVEVQIQTRALPSGTFVTVVDDTISGAVFGPYERSYNIQRPSNCTQWEFRCLRMTADSTDTTKTQDQIALSRYTEITQVQEPYNNSAIAAITFDASTLDRGAYPNRQYLFQGMIVRVPSNYDPVAKTYSGTWDYTFKYAWTDNPAWCALELMTNTRWGLGKWITDSQISMGSVYNCAVYCDQSITFTSSLGHTTTEARFTLNGTMDQADDPVVWLQKIMNVMHANFSAHQGLIYFNQDRPTSTTMIVGPGDIVQGSYWQEGSAATDRNSVVYLRFNDKANDYNIRTVTRQQDSSVTGTYYNELRMDLWGVTSEGQADREALWILDTQRYQTRVHHWQMGVEALYLKSFDVVEVFTPHLAGEQNAGRIVSINGTTVVLDRSVKVGSGTTIDIMQSDGTISTANVTNTAGNYTTITIDAAPTVAITPQASFIVKADIYHTLVRITDIKRSALNTWDITGVTYDPNKWARIEGQTVPSQALTWDPNYYTLGNPTNIVFTDGTDTSDGTVRRSLTISWQPPTQGQATSFQLRYRQNGGEFTTVNGITSPVYTIRNIGVGTVDIWLYAWGPTLNGGLAFSSGVQASHVVDISGTATSSLNAPTGLAAIGNGSGYSFTGQDLSFQWTNPSSNANNKATIKDFQLVFRDPNTSNTVNTIYVPAVAAGSTTNYTYTYAQNTADGGPRRSLIVEVRCRDTMNNLSAVCSATFSNAAPAAISGFTVTGMTKGMQLTWNRPTDADYTGVLVWQGTTSTFTPSQSTCVFEGDATLASLNNLTAGATYYYKIAAYDTFGKDYTGAGLNVSGALSGVAQAYPGTPSGTTLPTTGMNDGDFFYNTTSKHLYIYNSAQARWVMQGMQQGTTSQMNAVTGMLQGDQFYNTDDKRTYTYNGTKWIASSVLTGSSLPSSGSVGDLAYNTSDGLLYRWNGSSWVSTLPTTALSGQIQAGQVAANAVAANQIAAGTLSAGVVYAGNISATQITSGTMSAGYITAGTMAADRISGGTFNAGTMTVTNLSASSINAGTLDCSLVNVTNLTANKITSNSSTALTAYAGQITVMNNSAQSYIHSNSKYYGDGQWGFIFGAEANNSATWMDVYNGSGQIKMHTNGDFLITAGNGAMTLTQNGLTINQLNVIGTAQIANQSVTQAYALSTPAPASGNISSQDSTVSVTVSSNCSAVLVVATFGTISVSSGGEAGTGGSTAQCRGDIIVNGTVYASGYGGAQYVFVTPSAGTYTVTARRYLDSGANYGGSVSIYSLVSKK
jgi:predicted phage tail protein